MTISKRIEKIFSNKLIRTRMISLFEESMSYIWFHKPDWCLLRFNGSHLRLFAGRLIVLTIEREKAWVTTNLSTESKNFSNLNSWEWDEKSYPRYKRVPSRNGYYSPLLDKNGEWRYIKKVHFSYLDEVLTKGLGPDHRTTSKHEVEAMEYITMQTTRLTNQSNYLPISNDNDSMISQQYKYSTQGAIEGNTKLVFHIRRERNPAISKAKRNEALALKGFLQCEVCGFVTNENYDGFEYDICEIHHKSSLSKTTEPKKTELKDLAILCPNCHRAIHKTDPLLSVEDFRSHFLHHVNE